MTMVIDLFSFPLEGHVSLYHQLYKTAKQFPVNLKLISNQTHYSLSVNIDAVGLKTKMSGKTK